MKNKLYLLMQLVLFGMLSSCEITTIKPEPFYNDYETSNKIGDFGFETVQTTDNDIYITWSKPDNAVLFDVLINDTLSFTNLQKNFHLISGLDPTTSYKISVRALDSEYRAKLISKNITTQRQSLIDVKKIDIGQFEYKDYALQKYRKTSDGGFVFQGMGRKYEEWYTILVKTDANFNVQWHVNYLLVKAFGVQDVKECHDGGFLITTNLEVLKLSKLGKLVWRNNELTKQNSMDGVSNLVAGTELQDNSYLCVGNGSVIYPETSMGHSTVVLYKFSPDGKIQWEKNIESVAFIDKTAIQIIPDYDGNYIVFGTTNEKDEGNSNLNSLYTIWKIDKEGTQIDEHIYRDNTLPDMSNLLASSVDIIRTNDGHYYLMGQRVAHTYAVTYVTYTLKIDREGKFLWKRDPFDTTGYTESPESYKSSTLLEDNSLLVVSLSGGYTNVQRINHISADGVLIKTLLIENYPYIFYADKDKAGNYVLVTDPGYVFIIDPEGYTGLNY